jgi:restriction endonuclease
MAGVVDVAKTIVDSFDPARSVLLRDAVVEAMLSLGLTETDAMDWSTDQNIAALRRNLDERPQQKLPFEFSLRPPDRLIGKKRKRPDDTIEVQHIRDNLDVIEPLVDLLGVMDDTQFEHFCAAALLRAGATTADVTEPGNDGGIDFYGRIPVLIGDSDVPAGLVRTTLDVRPLLAFGQAKRYVGAVDRAELQAFAGQIRDCLNQYEGMQTPPAHHVPFSYFEKNETCLAFFFTTGVFTKGARDYASASNMILADGRLLAELLVYWRVVTATGGVNAGTVAEWIQSVRTASPLATPLEM